MKEIAAAFGTLDQAAITAIQNAETAGEAYTLALPGGDVVLNLGDYQISSEDMRTEFALFHGVAPFPEKQAVQQNSLGAS